MSEHNAANPIWYSPIWITAIAGLISAFLTVPEVLGSYLTKQQDIELAAQTVELAEIKNKPEDRPIILRFISQTSDRPDVKMWAESEVAMIRKP